MENCTGCLNCSFYQRLFGDLLPAEVEELGKNISVIHYNSQEIIIKQGSFISNLVCVKNGLVKVYIEGQNSKSFIVDLVSSGNIIGLAALYSKSHFRFCVSAINDTYICLIRADFLRELSKRNPVFNQLILGECSSQLEFYQQRIFSMGTKQNHGRLADAILYFTSEKYNGYRLFSELSRKDLADFCGMSVESVIRLLKEFRDDGLIQYEGKEIKINNFELLERLSRIG